MYQILFAEDEEVLGRLVKEALERQPDFAVIWAKDGGEALQRIQTAVPHLCILDVMMPVMDGFTLGREIRKMHDSLPILYLTARVQTEDVLRGFDAGGNDYLKKPFSVEELVVRVRELLRRFGDPVNSQQLSTPGLIKLGAYRFSPDTQVLRCGEHSYQLSNREASLLYLLVQHKNNLLERSAALQQVWGDDNFFNARTMDVYIARLRKYLVHDARLSIINIRGYGYKLTEQAD